MYLYINHVYFLNFHNKCKIGNKFILGRTETKVPFSYYNCKLYHSYSLNINFIL